MTTDQASPRRGLSRPLLSLGLWVGLLSLAGGAVVLFLFDPDQYHVYPVCLFHQFTGLQCPGCGGTRALFNLLHGRVLAALRCNAMVVIVLAVLAPAGVRWLARELTGKAHPPLEIRPLWLKLAVAAFILFTILRNLPFAPFTYLAPP